MRKQDLAKILGERIKIARWKKVLKQCDLAKNIGVMNSFLSEIEHGKRLVHTELLFKLEQELGPIWPTARESE